MDTTWLTARLSDLRQAATQWALSPQFYTQAALTLLAVGVAYLAAAVLRWRLTPAQPAKDSSVLPWRRIVEALRSLLFPLLTIVMLGVAVSTSETLVGQSGFVRLCQSLAVVFLVYSAITRFVRHPTARAFATWVVIPVAILYVLDWLGPVTAHLEAIDVEAGNIRVSAYGLVRVAIFGSLLFWFGRLSNLTGQRVIREQEALEISTREVLAKLFQIAVFSVIFFVLLQIMGISLTALAVFGGAVGVGLGFGLQSIASNFVSGIILLLDRSLTVGDYVELESGKTGIIRELNMRSTVLETFDGKDIVVPNETFISSTFTNWTHKDKRQRYSLEFQVAYETDVPAMLDLVRTVVLSHPEVLDGPGVPDDQLADVEIKGFGESGIDILVEFWMDAIDEGQYHVSADLLLMIWQALRDHAIEMPFPQREIRIRSSAPPVSLPGSSVA